jgi:4-diphosphocytidyl-2C-methyl-D-erythritol kinase
VWCFNYVPDAAVRHTRYRNNFSNVAAGTEVLVAMVTVAFTHLGCSVVLLSATGATVFVLIRDSGRSFASLRRE